MKKMGTRAQSIYFPYEEAEKLEKLKARTGLSKAWLIRYAMKKAEKDLEALPSYEELANEI